MLGDFRMRLIELGRLVVVLALLGACSSSEATDASGTAGAGIKHPECAGAIEFSIGVARTSAAGMKVAIVEATPAQPHVGDNVWVVRITDSSDAPVEGAIIVVKSVMPAHGHSSPRTAQITPLDDGKYELNPVNFTMSMLWEITIEVTPNGSPADSVN